MKFSELLYEYRVSMAPEGHHHARPGWVQFDCPFCGKGSRKWHMGFNIAYGYVNCWRCGRHKLRETLVELLGLDAKAVHKLVGEVDLDRRVPRKRERGKLAIPRGVGPLAVPHRRYLRKRGFEPTALARLWDIGGIGLGGMGQGMQWRLYIPIYLHGEQISWTTRSLSENAHGKYKTARPEQESISHKDVLYGADYCRGTALVFEGPPDVWRVGPGAVCTFGTQWSDEQLLLLSQFPQRYICFDNEAIAQQRARALFEKLGLFDEGETHLVTVTRHGRDFTKRQVQDFRNLL